MFTKVLQRRAYGGINDRLIYQTVVHDTCLGAGVFIKSEGTDPYAEFVLHTIMFYANKNANVIKNMHLCMTYLRNVYGVNHDYIVHVLQRDYQKIYPQINIIKYMTIIQRIIVPQL